MPLLLSQLSLNTLKHPHQSSHKLSTVSTSNGRTPSLAAISTPTTDQPRRSQHTRRPSVHQRESDEYQASSRGSSRPPSPSERTSGKKPKKLPFGKRGERPGRIIQPTNVKAAAYASSLEPLTPAGSRLDNTFLASQGPARGSVEIICISKAEAIQWATAYLGADVSHLDSKTIQKILDQIPQDTEEDHTAPLEPEGGSAPALLQSARRVVLGSRHQPPAARATSGVGSPQGPDVQSLSTHGSYAPEAPPLEEPPANDSATEPESEHESVELGPGDSVSQQLPRARHSQQPLHARQIPHSHPIATPTTPHPAKTTPVPNGVDNKSDTDTINESDEERMQSDHESEVLHAPKRQRLTHRSPSPAFRISRPIPSIPRKPTHSARPPIRLPPLVPASSLATTANLGQGLSKPPPSADLNAVLAWAVQVTKRATTSNHANGPLNVLAQVLGDACSHLANSPPTRLTKSRHYGYPQDTDLIEDNAETLEAEAALALGLHVRQRNKPTLADFPGLPWQVASRAIPELIATACTEGPFEVFRTVDAWSDQCYNTVWAREVLGTALIKAPRRLRALMVRRCSWFRGETVKRVRPYIPFHYGFIHSPQTLEEVRHNRDLAKSLLPNNFHCSDPASGEDPYEHPVVRDCIAAAFFWGADSPGIAYHDKFRPTPLPTAAMILTFIQHCIQEWGTGRFVKIILSAATQLDIYESHLKGLLAYEKKAPVRLAKFCDDWFWYGVDWASSSDHDEPYQAITAADRIRPDTPTSDMDTQARAEGKARAVD